MELIKVFLFDEVEMKKPHPCIHKSHRFQIVMLGADLKLQCLGCGNIVLISRIKFNQKYKKTLSTNKGPLFIK